MCARIAVLLHCVSKGTCKIQVAQTVFSVTRPPNRRPIPLMAESGLALCSLPIAPTSVDMLQKRANPSAKIGATGMVRCEGSDSVIGLGR